MDAKNNWLIDEFIQWMKGWINKEVIEIMNERNEWKELLMYAVN